MKSTRSALIVFTTILLAINIILGVDSRRGNEGIVCPSYPVNVNCAVDPCKNLNCPPSKKCCQDYSEGCNAHCIAKGDPKFQCPDYGHGEISVACAVSPCFNNECEVTENCCEDYSRGSCDHHCLSAKE